MQLKKRVLITGVDGFIGGYLVPELICFNRQYNVLGISRHSKLTMEDYNHNWIYNQVGCNLESERDVSNVMSLFNPDIIFHLAASPLVKENQSRPTDITKSNVLITHNLLAHAPHQSRFVLASSATVYGNTNRRCFEESPIKASSIYAATKIASENYVSVYTELGKVRGVSARLVANVGPGSTHGVVHDFVRKLHSPSYYLEILGDYPGSHKPYVHVRDTVKALELISRSDMTGAINIGPEDQLSISELADFVMEGLDIHKPKLWLGANSNWKGDQSFVSIGNGYIKDLGWRPKYTSSKDAVFYTAHELTQTNCFKDALKLLQ